MSHICDCKLSLPGLSSLLGGLATGDHCYYISTLQIGNSLTQREEHRLPVLLVPTMEEGLRPDGILTPHSVASPRCWSNVPPPVSISLSAHGATRPFQGWWIGDALRSSPFGHQMVPLAQNAPASRRTKAPTATIAQRGSYCAIPHPLWFSPEEGLSK